jgi:hypothetical protein
MPQLGHAPEPKFSPLQAIGSGIASAWVDGQSSGLINSILGFGAFCRILYPIVE